MRKKINSEAGLTVVEMLAAVAVLTLLVLMLNTGLQMVMNTYQTIIAQSEVELLLSTAVDAIADDLRYAWNVQGRNGAQIIYNSGDKADNKHEFFYSSDSYGENTYLDVDSNGRIVAKQNDSVSEKLVLSTGAYGSDATTTYKKYKVTFMEVQLNKDMDSGEITFDIELKVETTDSRKISAETTVTVRCLNPAKNTTS